MSREAADLNQSVLIAQSVAEVWKSEGTEGLKQRFDADGPAAYRNSATDEEVARMYLYINTWYLKSVV